MSLSTRLQTTHEFPLTARFGEQTFGYTAHVNLLGEVVQIESLLAQLPINARRLALGTADYEKHLNDTENIGQYLSYLIPLSLFDLPFKNLSTGPSNDIYDPLNEDALVVPASELVHIKETIMTVRAALNIPYSCFPAELANTDWMRACCSLLGKYFDGDFSSEQATVIETLIQFYDQRIDTYLSRSLGVYLYKFPCPLAVAPVVAIWPVLHLLAANTEKEKKSFVQHNQRACLSALAKNPSSVGADFAKQQLQKTDNTIEASKLTKLLIDYPTSNNYNFLVKLLKAKMENDASFHYESVWEAFIHHPTLLTPEHITVAQQFVRNKTTNRIAHCYAAHALLFQHNQDKDALAKAVDFTATKNEIQIDLWSFTMSHAFLIRSPALLPPLPVLADLILRYLTEDLKDTGGIADFTIRYFLYLVMEQYPTGAVSKVIDRFCQHESIKVVEVALRWANCLLDSIHSDFEPSNLLFAQCQKYFVNEHNYLKTESLKLLIYRSRQQKDLAIIPALLPHVSKDGYCCLRKYAILGINSLLKEVNYDPSIEATYLPLIKEKFGYCYDGQAAIVRALSLSPSKAIQRAVAAISIDREAPFPMIYTYGEKEAKLLEKMNALTNEVLAQL